MRRCIAAAAFAVAMWAPVPVSAQLNGPYCGANGDWCLNVMYSGHWSLGPGTLFGFVGQFDGDALSGVKSVQFLSALMPEEAEGTLRTSELTYRYHGYAGYFGLMTWDGMDPSAWDAAAYVPAYDDLFLSWSGFDEDGALLAQGACGPTTGFSCRPSANVPEPPAPLLMLTGMVGLAFVASRRRMIAE